MRAIFALPIAAIIAGAVAGFMLPIEGSEAQQSEKCARYEKTFADLDSQANDKQCGRF